MSPKLKAILAVVTGALLLLISAYINGYPVVYSDTSTYLASGFEVETPFDRPITYGLFLRFASLNGFSLWSVIFMQGLIVSYLVFNLLGVVKLRFKNLHLLHVAVMAFLGVLTSASWTTSQLIADIFAPIALLSLILLAIGTSKKGKLIFLYFLFVMATAMHMSHIMINIITIICILIIRQLNLFGVEETIKVKPLIICFGLTVLSIAAMGSALSKSKYAFLMGALVEHGIVKEYLDDNCEAMDYQFCAYKDSLPDKAWIFLWDENSPFYKMGGWKGTKEEFKEIINNTLTSPKYLGLHFRESIKATGDQLTKFKIGDGNGPFLEPTLLHKRVGMYFHRELPAYESSRQNKGNLGYLVWYNKVIYVVVILSVLALLVLLFKAQLLDKKVLSMILIVMIGVLVNAWACGTFANAIDRLGAKSMWLIPLVAIVGLLNIRSKR